MSTNTLQRAAGAELREGAAVEPGKLGRPSISASDGALLPHVFVEQLTERETEDIQHHCIYENSDCRGHDRHNPDRTARSSRQLPN